MRLVNVALGARSYSIIVENGLIDKITDHIPDERVALVTTPEINRLYGEKIGKGLDAHKKIMVPDGEDAKQWEVVERLLGDMLEAGLDRNSVVIALGGGTVGDVAGFAASIYMRGIRVIHIPTTLLAMVDSSIGGKTAVNHPRGKNLVGSFHQPYMVLIDPLLLETLPIREVRSGMAEVIKYGVISDPELFTLLMSTSPEDLTPEVSEEITSRCAAIKAGYVERDEHDRDGIRADLNFGHTVGHVVETLTHHSVNHGEGVAIGMIAAAYISVINGLLSREEYELIRRLIKKYRLPDSLPEMDLDKAIEVMHRDKKAQRGEIKFVLPTGIGEKPVLMTVDEDTIRAALEKLV